MNQPSDEKTTPELPKAEVTRRPRLSWVWIIPVFALCFVGWLIARSYAHRGPRVQVLFKQSQGLEPGKSELRYRGAKVGLVTELRLTKDLDSVIVTIEMIKSAADLTRSDSSFWIVQPEVTAEKIRGLRAIVSGDYIEVKPGGGARTNFFIGVDEAPVRTHDLPGLNITLLNPKVGSLQRGSAIYYRGVQVGEVLSFQLTPDSQAVTIAAQIDEQYAPLIRENTKFWNAGGIQMNVGLFSGANIRAESLRTLVAGGVAFATPDPPGKRVHNGAAFRLYDKAEEDWEKWAPNIRLEAPPSRQTAQ